MQAYIEKGKVIMENSDSARQLHDANGFGALTADGRVVLGVYEAIYLVEKEKVFISNAKETKYSSEKLAKVLKIKKDFWTRYSVYKDLRDRGYLVKTALKFGGVFRVYARGKKPGETHARWVVFPVSEQETLTWHEFSAKNRVAHSTKKRLLIAVVDDELDVTYWESRWLKP